MSNENDKELLTWKIVEQDNPLEPPVQKLVAISGEELVPPMTVEEFRAMTEKVGELITELLEGARKSFEDYCSKRDMGGENFTKLANALVQENIKDFVTREAVTVFLVSKGRMEKYEAGEKPAVRKTPGPTETKTSKAAKRVIAKPTSKQQKAATKKKPPEPATLFAPSPKLARGDFVRAMMFRSMEDAVLNLWQGDHKEDWGERTNVCINTQLLWDAACEDETVPPLDPRWKKGLTKELKSEGWIIVRTEGNRAFARPRLNHPMWVRKQDTTGFWYEKYGA